jgi:hypothetical protein
VGQAVTSIRPTPAEPQDLLGLDRRSSDHVVRHRAHILLLLADGHSWAIISAVVFCSLGTGTRGVLVNINSDSHAVHEIANLQFGVGQARRGWLEKEDVLKTRPLAELRSLLAGTFP